MITKIKKTGLEKILSSDNKNRYSEKTDSLVESELRIIANNAERALALINNKGQVSDKYFVENLGRVVEFIFNEDDCYSVLKLLYGDKYNKYYNGHTRIRTDMRTIFDNGFYDETCSYGVDLEVLHDDKTVLNSMDRYTMSELTELVKNNSIVIVQEYFNMTPTDISERTNNYFEFTYKTKANKDVKNQFTYNMFFSERSEIFPYTVKFIRNMMATDANIRSLVLMYLRSARECIEKAKKEDIIKQCEEKWELMRLHSMCGRRGRTD
jgi:hypothetical protein